MHGASERPSECEWVSDWVFVCVSWRFGTGTRSRTWKKRKETKQIHVEKSEFICLFVWLFKCRVWEYMSKFEHTERRKKHRCGLLNYNFENCSTTHCYSLCERAILFSHALSLPLVICSAPFGSVRFCSVLLLLPFNIFFLVCFIDVRLHMLNRIVI